MFKEKITEIVNVNKNGTTSVLSVDLSISGDVKSDGILEVEGKIEGDVIGNNVTFRETSIVKGNVFAKTLNLKGKFDGVIKSERVNISGKANINGTIEYNILCVEDGAVIFADLKRTNDFKNLSKIEKEKVIQSQPPKEEEKKP
ncbi:MAG: polymer-forming cytoskeletal protein [Rickettsiales bacterium]|jgi:cytoskeletal protein CcmA (bactofilin family)|nr:polymer-forming cytoskeletal protein [Rickettsiales bacterium]